MFDLHELQSIPYEKPRGFMRETAWNPFRIVSYMEFHESPTNSRWGINMFRCN